MATPTPTPRSVADTLGDLANSPELIFPVYALILTPLALYVYQDILDRRWRPVWRLVKFLVAYILLYLISGMGLIAYIILQGVYGSDYKEVGASALALILGTYGAWKLVRLARIILAHRSLVAILQRIDAGLCKLTGLPPVGLEYRLFRKRKNLNPDTTRREKVDIEQENRHDYISASLFDDDYPGEAAARIRWLAFFGGKVLVLQEDADECASRVALWMRLVLRRPRSEPWRLLTSTSPLVQGHLYRASMGEALRSLITCGSAVPPPAHASINPAEELLNNGCLTEVGVGFFWMASQMGAEEISQVLAEMPPRWMRGVTQNGKQLMFELVMSLLMCEMPEEEDEDLRWILSLPVLDWRRDVANLRVWSVMAKICADAVLCVMPRYSHMGEMPAEETIYETVRHGVFQLKEATSKVHGFQGDIVGLSLIELIRSAYRAGYMTERILGKDLQDELLRNDWTGNQYVLRLYKAEIVSGLFAILEQLGCHDCEPYQETFNALKDGWGLSKNIPGVLQAVKAHAFQENRESFNLDVVSSSRCWFLGDRREQCEDPPSAFATVSTTAAELAPFVLIMLTEYVGAESLVHIPEDQGDPDKYREQWLSWKHSQAMDLRGSTGLQRLGSLKLHAADRGDAVMIDLQ